MPNHGRLSQAAPEESRLHLPAEGAPCVAVSATFTAEAIHTALSFWLRELGLEWDIRFAPYNQVFQQLLDPASLLARNRSGANLILVRFQDWGDGVETHAARLLDAVLHFRGPLIVAICPPTAAHLEAESRAETILRAGLGNAPGVQLLTPDQISAWYPVDDVHDPHADELGHVPYTPLFFAALGTAIMRTSHAAFAAPFKVIALDCDDTLWSGICGEDGPRGVTLDPPRLALQQFMAAQRDAGMLLTLCTKNNPDDVEETFQAHPDMPLRFSDFVARRINWEPKGPNLASLGAELDLGTDSFIFVDDNPKECTEVQSSMPEVLSLALPAAAAEIPAFLQHVWAFDRARTTEEDRRRSNLYAQQAERTRLARSAASLQEFIESLRLEVAVAPMRPDQVRRVAQLTQRTNQMNFTAIRRGESELQDLAGAEVLAVDVTDRFGDYGLTGVVIFRVSAAALTVDTFLLSCRVLGRGVEHRVLAHLGAIARERGLSHIELPFVATPRNTPGRMFLESVAHRNGEGPFIMDAAAAEALTYQPGDAFPPAVGGEAPAAAPRRRIDYARIAAELRDPGRILDRMEASRPRATAVPAAPPMPARTPLESGLVDLWRELLRLPAVGIHDNFFELGGHSLLAVHLLSRVRQIWGVDLSLEVVYSGPFTVAELAKAIELKEFEEAAGADYQKLLEELENLSDEEVRALLEKEQGGA